MKFKEKKVMKKIILALGLIITLLLFVGAKNSHKDEMKSTITTIEYSADYETPLVIEDWMMNSNNFEVFEATSEESLVIEDWMMDGNNFEVFETATEEPLIVEDWMLSERYWN